jgi:uncharacterized protein DUF3618
MGPEQDSPAVNSPKEDTRSSSEIESNIRRTRDRLDDTLENLNERLSPRALMNDILNWFESRGVHQAGSGSADSLGRGYRNVVREVKQNPLPAVLIGAGIAWWIFKPENDDVPGGRYQTSDAADDVWVPKSPGPSETDFVSHESSQKSGIASMVKEKGGQAQEALSGATEAVTEKVSNIGSGVKASARAAGNAITESIRRGTRAGSDATQNFQKGYGYAGDRFQEAVEEYPLAVAGGFLGVGLLTGLLLPRTRQEDRLVGEKSDSLIEHVKETGRETLDKVKAVAERVGQTSIEEAKKQGITPETAGDKISEMAGKLGAVASQAKKEAVRAAEEAQLKPSSKKEQSKARGEISET